MVCSHQGPKEHAGPANGRFQHQRADQGWGNPAQAPDHQLSFLGNHLLVSVRSTWNCHLKIAGCRETTAGLDAAGGILLPSSISAINVVTVNSIHGGT